MLCEVEDYNFYKRVVQVKKLFTDNPASEDPCQPVDYSYDQGPGGVGRLTRVRWGWTTGQVLPGLIGVIPCPVPGGLDESYTYNAAGRLLSKNVQHIPGNIYRVAELKLNYMYDTNGRVTSVTYPFRVLRAQTGSGRPVANITYDSMGRMSGLTWPGVPGSAGDPVPAPVTVASGAVYDARNALTSLNMLGVVETRQFNVLGQLTRITQAGAIDIEYRFSATANDGKITSQKNWISGEEVTYQYDELERLSTATTTAPEWGLSWSYDGFGNRLSQSVTKGSGPTSTTLVDAWTNRISSAGFNYDLNGNMTAMPQLNSTLTYDWSNRVTGVNNSNGSHQYAYAPDNRRIWFKTGLNEPLDFSLNNGERYVLYSPGGQKMGTYKLDTSGGPTDPLGYFAIEENIYWGGKLVARHNANAGGALQRTTQDRLSSEGTFFPFGEYRSNSSTMGGSGREAFATYTRDSQTGLDYADQRYYAGALGRFVTSDPYDASAGEANPGSWNRFSYVLADPITFYDPEGLAAVPAGPAVPAWVPAENRSAPSGPGTAPASPNIYNVFAQICIGKRCVTSQVNTGSILGRNDELSELRVAERWYDLGQQYLRDWSLDEDLFKNKYGKKQSEIEAKYGNGFSAFSACRDEGHKYLLNNNGGLPQFALYDNALRLADTILSVLNRTTIGRNGERSESVLELQIIVRRLLYDDAPDINGLRTQASTAATGLFNSVISDCAKNL